MAGPEGEEEPAAREARRRTEGGELPCPGGPERDEQRDRAEAREILEVIRDEGVAERVDIDEAERGRECDREVEDRRKRPSPDPIPEPPCRGNDSGGGQGKAPLPPSARVDLPARVDEGEPDRGHELGGVEPQRATGQHTAVGRGERPGRALRSDLVLLHHRRPEPGRQADEEERNERHEVAARERSPLPPDTDEGGCGHGTRNSLAEDGEHEGDEGHGVERRGAPAEGEAEREEEGQEREDARLDVLQLRRPGDRFHVHRMEREHRRRHPRPGDREPGEGEPDEPGVQRV